MREPYTIKESIVHYEIFAESTNINKKVLMLFAKAGINTKYMDSLQQLSYSGYIKQTKKEFSYINKSINDL